MKLVDMIINKFPRSKVHIQKEHYMDHYIITCELLVPEQEIFVLGEDQPFDNTRACSATHKTIKINKYWLANPWFGHSVEFDDQVMHTSFSNSDARKLYKHFNKLHNLNEKVRYQAKLDRLVQLVKEGADA